MLLKVPFYVNWHNQCVQTALRSAIRYFKHFDVGLNELDQLTWRQWDNRTWTTQTIPLLCSLWLDVKYYSALDIRPLLAWEQWIKKLFPKDYELLINHTDVDVLIKSVQKTIELDVFEHRKLNIWDLEDCIRKNKLPLVVINYNKTLWKYRNKKNVPFQWHMVVVVGFDRDNIIYHESWPRYFKDNKKISKDIFYQAMSDEWTWGDVVVVWNAL